MSLFVISNIFTPRYYLGDVYDRIPFLLAAAAFASHIIVSLIKKESLFSFNMPAALIVVFWLFALYSTHAQTADVERSLHYFDVITKAIIVFLLVYNILNTINKIKLFLGILVVSAFGLGYRMVNFPVWERGRAFIDGTTYGGDPNITTMIIVTALPVAVGLMFLYQSRMIRLALLYSMFIMLLGIVEAQSRGGFLALLAGVSYGILQIKGFKNRVIAALLVLMVGGGFFVRYAPPSYFDRMQQILNPDTDRTGSAQARTSAMASAFEYTIRHPISQYGLGNHSYYIAEKYGISPLNEDIFRGSFLAHNIFLQLGADMGLFPLFVYLFFIWFLFKRLRRVTRISMQVQTGSDSKDLFILAKVLRVSLVCWLINAFFLPVAYQFFSYYIAGTSVALYQAIRTGVIQNSSA
ncbi:MAG: O-antigen ligase family protein [Desulfotignum sp.]|nr:O-antigen ligase family protein [Desulfotignum sp.]MCF8089961.1 O-antigen ligase family protein [Desulfotignum sp.]MCF8135809.1 O-antigen ligase family protein [Desulfotignum sp.]